MKNNKIWQSEKSIQPNEYMLKYILGDELKYEDKLLKYDIQASKAHANMLGECGLITTDEASTISKSLDEILTSYNNGDWIITEEMEDVHTAIEIKLVEKCGNLGKQIHLGRSRNDQVLVATRLMCIEQIDVILNKCKSAASQMLNFAEQHQKTPMPGFTHMQYAMPSSVGQWMAAYVESFICDIKNLQGVKDVVNCNPLGSAAGFGTHVPINRDLTTKELNFSTTQINPIFCQNSRGKFEALILNALMQISQTASKFANDMVIFCSQQFKFFTLDSSLTTGSSIMPQKRNPDLYECMRSNLAVMQAYQLQAFNSSTNLISGYNKDSKVSKQPLFDGLDLTLSTLEMLKISVPKMTVNKENLLKCFEDKTIFAADMANDLVMNEGYTFRDAYKFVKDNLNLLDKYKIEEVIEKRNHQGSLNNLCLDEYKEFLKK